MTKRPSVSEAWQWDGGIECADLILEWVDRNGGYAYHHPNEQWIILPNHMDPVRATDWIIRDAFGEFHIAPDKTFKAVYAGLVHDA